MSLFPMPLLDEECEHCAGTGKTIDQRALGKALRATREAGGVTLTDLAAALAITKSYLCDLELGRRDWRKALVVRYHEACSKLTAQAGGLTK